VQCVPLTLRLLGRQAGTTLPAWPASPAGQAAAISTVPMSKFEPEKCVDYDTMADKLKARPLRAPAGGLRAG
jgi:hypothetical protein